MKRLKRLKFICYYADCKVLPFENIHHHEVFECPHRSILCQAQGCKFINNVKTLIIYSINCPFYLLYCAICKSLFKLSVITHDCNMIISQRTIPSVFKYYYNNSPPNHTHKNGVIRINSFIENFEDNEIIIYDTFMSFKLIKPFPTDVFTRRILKRQNAVKDLSFSTTTTTNIYNNIF